MLASQQLRTDDTCEIQVGLYAKHENQSTLTFGYSFLDKALHLEHLVIAALETLH